VGFFVDITEEEATSGPGSIGECFDSAVSLSVLSSITNFVATELPPANAGSKGNCDLSIDAKFLLEACNSSMKPTAQFLDSKCLPTYSNKTMLRTMLSRRTHFLLVNSMTEAGGFVFFYSDVDDADCCDPAVSVTISYPVTHWRHVSLGHLATGH
jgi:hypothetical protein